MDEDIQEAGEADDNPLQESKDDTIQESNVDDKLQPLEVKVVSDSQEYSVYDTQDSDEYDTLLSKDKANIKKDLDIDG